MIVSADLLPYVSSLVVDTKKEFLMFRVRKVKDKTKLIPSDHFPLVIRLKNQPTNRIKREQTSNWNLNKIDGWKKFKNLQLKMKEKTDEIIGDKTLTIDEGPILWQNKVNGSEFKKT